MGGHGTDTLGDAQDGSGNGTVYRSSNGQGATTAARVGLRSSPGNRAEGTRNKHPRRGTGRSNFVYRLQQYRTPAVRNLHRARLDYLPRLQGPHQDTLLDVPWPWLCCRLVSDEEETIFPETGRKPGKFGHRKGLERIRRDSRLRSSYPQPGRYRSRYKGAHRPLSRLRP